MIKRLSDVPAYLIAACLLTLPFFFSPATQASGPGANWPQWRGPDGQGISLEKNLPAEWSDTKNVRWKTPIPGRGHSSPIVWDDRIFMTTSIEGETMTREKPIVHMLGDKEFKHPDWAGSNHKQTLKVVCVDAKTGKLLWEQTSFEGITFDHRHRKNTYASPTPVTDGRYVYVSFGSEGVYCYDFKGKLIWKQSLGGIPTLGMGAGTSPVLYKDLVILQCDQHLGENSFIAALDKKTGKEAWRAKRPVQSSWTTPVIVNTATRAELVTNGNEWVISYDPATGKEYWRCQGVKSNAIHTPLVGKDLVIVSAGYPQKRTIAIRLGGSGDLTETPNVLWKYEKGTAYVASPILYGDYVYLISDKGLLTCLDAKTGEVKYEGGRVPVPATFMASPVAFDGKILISSEDGDTFVVKAGATHEILRTNSIGEPIYTSPALAGGKVYIRAEKHLYCIGNGK
ncbi:MAG: PQQ-binding-like beta-propeller repeat protein [Blastocatellia bacterium]|nr:PQQ-binding-like beta-propeller repeat protein [Blastocatellia bacterium]